MFLKATLLLFAVMCLWYVEESVCFPNGLVEPACGSMMPQHSLSTPSNSSPPYNVSASSSSYRPGQVITVTVESVNSSIVFEGFLLQARSIAGNDLIWPLGKFTNINTTQFNGLRCNNSENSSVSQASSTKRKKVQFTWEAPSNSNYGDIYFSATVVKNFSVFWVQLNSSPLTLDTSGTSSDGVSPSSSSSSSALFFITLLSLCIY